jgi:hypothetical protein
MRLNMASQLACGAIVLAGAARLSAQSRPLLDPPVFCEESSVVCLDADPYTSCEDDGDGSAAYLCDELAADFCLNPPDYDASSQCVPSEETDCGDGVPAVACIID